MEVIHIHINNIECMSPIIYIKYSPPLFTYIFSAFPPEVSGIGRSWSVNMTVTGKDDKPRYRAPFRSCQGLP
jgi:hypothetical protein